MGTISTTSASRGEPPVTIDGIVARRVAPTGIDSTEIVLQEDKIRFLMIGRPRLSTIIEDAPWARTLSLARDHVYARTADGVFLTRFRSLAEAEEKLTAYGGWLRLHQSSLVNASRMKWIELGATKRKLVGFELQDGRPTGESLEIGPTYVTSVRTALGFCRTSQSAKTKSKKKRAEVDIPTTEWASEEPRNDDLPEKDLDENPGPHTTRAPTGRKGK